MQKPSWPPTRRGQHVPFRWQPTLEGAACTIHMATHPGGGEFYHTDGRPPWRGQHVLCRWHPTLEGAALCSARYSRREVMRAPTGTTNQPRGCALIVDTTCTHTRERNRESQRIFCRLQLYVISCQHRCCGPFEHFVQVGWGRIARFETPMRRVDATIARMLLPFF